MWSGPVWVWYPVKTPEYGITYGCVPLVARPNAVQLVAESVVFEFVIPKTTGASALAPTAQQASAANTTTVTETDAILTRIVLWNNVHRWNRAQRIATGRVVYRAIRKNRSWLDEMFPAASVAVARIL